MNKIFMTDMNPQDTMILPKKPVRWKICLATHVKKLK